jgi:hypothetical protein
MKTYGKYNCDAIRSLTGEAKLGATYYDLERVAYQIAAYTGDSSWNSCASQAESAYRDNYVRKAEGEFGYGAVPGYWVFTDGLRQDFEQTGDAQSKDAVANLAKAASLCALLTPIEWSATASTMREVSYCLNAYLDNEALGVALPPRANQLLDQLLGHIDQTIDGTYRPAPEDDVPAVCKGKPYVQPFMLGIAMKTLIEWNSVHPDSRVQPAVKRAADFMWDKLRYYPTSATQGARFWYEACAAAPGSPFNLWLEPGNGPSDDLNLLFAPGFAWLYSKTGDPVYRDRGDQIWTVGVKDAAQNGLNSKQFNQNYLWSFDYIKYRSK